MEYTENTAPSHYPVAFIGDAQYVCPTHAKELWGQWRNGLNTVFDSEGNEVTAVYSWNEGDGDRCDICDPILGAIVGGWGTLAPNVSTIFCTKHHPDPVPATMLTRLEAYGLDAACYTCGKALA